MNASDPPPIASKSLLGSMASVSQRRWLGVLAVTLAFLAAALVFALWVLFPWGPIDGFAVESAQRTTTPPRILVIFSTPTPLEAVLKRKDAGFINATLSDCRSGDRRESEVAAQRAGYFPDEGRVRRLSPSGGGAVERIRYQVSFDDVDGEGLCFSLDGGSMWAGKLWSDRIPLTLIRS